MNNYRVRAFVDRVQAERFVQALSPEHAMLGFSKIQLNGETLDRYPIELAMVHAVTFDEDGPKFHDQSGMVSDKWARCSYSEACSFYTKQSNAEHERQIGENMDSLEIIKVLSEVEGPCSVHEGMLWLEDGTSINLTDAAKSRTV